GQGIQGGRALASRRRAARWWCGVKAILIAGAIAMIVSILFTPYLIRFFSRQGFGQEIREEGPQGHQSKRGTPTMGGVAIMVAMWVGYIVAHVVSAMSKPPGEAPTAS